MLHFGLKHTHIGEFGTKGLSMSIKSLGKFTREPRRRLDGAQGNKQGKGQPRKARIDEGRSRILRQKREA